MAVPHRVTRRPALLTRQLSPIRACIHVRCSILTHAKLRGLGALRVFIDALHHSASGSVEESGVTSQSMNTSRNSQKRSPTRPDV